MPFPQNNLTVQAIYAAYVAAHDNFDSFGINVGELGGECDRSIYYSFRWASKLELFDGKKLRRFETGNGEEARLIADLERAGVAVFGQQDRIRFVAGHVRGKIDGKATNVPASPEEIHLCEFKATNDSSFKALHKEGCKEAKPAHFVQCQLGMHAFGLLHALYMVVDTNDDAIYEERIPYDAEFCANILARAEKLIKAQQPPAKISDKPDYYLCGMCKHWAVCHANAFPRVTCRSCIHSTPELGGDNAHWSCARWDKPLSFDEQKAACPVHLFDPVFVPGEQIDADDEAETITYKMHNGSTWTDGTRHGD